jgi:hypothetical protein
MSYSSGIDTTEQPPYDVQAVRARSKMEKESPENWTLEYFNSLTGLELLQFNKEQAKKIRPS